MKKYAELKTILAIGACSVVFVFFAACGSSPPVRYFSLEPVYESTVNDGVEKPIVGLGELRTPNHLYRSQMVTRGRGGELIVHDFQRWSEPLDQGIHRVVAANVDSLLENLTVIAFPFDSMVRPMYRVYGSVERFDVDDTGRAVLIVQWGITLRDRAVVAAPGRSRYEANASNTSDPTANVEALNDVLAAFSREIAERLRTAVE
jgi:uncharacterized lipoprotein YmbA